MSGFLVEKWVCALERLQPQHDCLVGGSSPFLSGPPSHGGLTSFLHASMWTPMSRHHAAAPHAALELKALRTAGKAAAAATRATARLLTRVRVCLLSGAVTVVSVPATAVARAYDDTISAARSIPSTARIAAWAVRSGLCYKRLMALYSDHDCQEYVDQLQSLHTRLAHTLVQVSVEGVERANRNTAQTVISRRHAVFTRASALLLWGRIALPHPTREGRRRLGSLHRMGEKAPIRGRGPRLSQPYLCRRSQPFVFQVQVRPGDGRVNA